MRVSIELQPNRRKARRDRCANGTVSTGLLLTLIALVLFVLAFGTMLWLQGQSEDRSETPPKDPLATAGTGTQGAESTTLQAPVDGEGAAASSDERTASASPEAAQTQAAFVGHGLIRGRVVPAPGASLPTTGQVVLDPISWKHSPPRGTRRELEFNGEAPDFVFEEVPLGAYRIHAVGAGMDSRFSDVVLQVGADQVYKMVELRPAGFVDGRVLDEQGEALEGLRVRLEAELGDLVFETITNAAGEWVVSGVPIGGYRVTFGDPLRPLVPARSFQFGGGSSRFPEQRISPQASILVRAIDMHGDPVVAAEVTGFERAGGSYHPITDEYGVVRVRYLVPGRYTAVVEHRSGLSGQTNIDLQGNEDQMAFQVVCRMGNGREWR